MDKKWRDLSPEEKLEERFKRWLSPGGVKFRSPEAAAKYIERTNRLKAALTLNEPDRVPVILPAGNFPAYYAGLDLKTVMYDYELLRKVWARFLRDFGQDMDSFIGPNLTYPGRALEIMDYRLYKWPGHGLGDKVDCYQFVEGEYMMADEYDGMMKDPSGFMLRTVLPRQFGALGPLKKLVPLSAVYGRPLNSIASFALPEVREAFEAFIEAGKEWETWQQYVVAFAKEAVSEGFASLRGSMATAPFDIIGDSLRGTQGIILDMYRQPGKLLQALDLLTPLIIEQTVSTVNAMGGFIVTFPLHKGDDTFMSDRQFETFYWPTLKQFILALRQEGIMSFLFAEGKFMRRLEMIRDLPRGWSAWHFDQTDMARAKEVLGGTSCIVGNVPASLMCTGTPEAVKEYCRKLIEACGRGGGYILAGGAQATEATSENFHAMMAAAKEYGIYKK
jgi:hypothetical protein